jgi:hypothetical protein
MRVHLDVVHGHRDAGRIAGPARAERSPAAGGSGGGEPAGGGRRHGRPGSRSRNREVAPDAHRAARSFDGDRLVEIGEITGTRQSFMQRHPEVRQGSAQEGIVRRRRRYGVPPGHDRSISVGGIAGALEPRGVGDREVRESERFAGAAVRGRGHCAFLQVHGQVEVSEVSGEFEPGLEIDPEVVHHRRGVRPFSPGGDGLSSRVDGSVQVR